MTDQNKPKTANTDASNETDVEPTRLQKLVTKYPRASRVVALTGAVTAVVGTLTVANTVRKNKHHLDSAKDNVLEAAGDFSNAVSPDPETAA